MKLDTFCKLAADVANEIEGPEKKDNRFAATKLLTILGLLGGGLVGAAQGGRYGANPLATAIAGAMHGGGTGMMTGGAIDLGRAGINYFTDQNK